jgi:hypothetical protein
VRTIAALLNYIMRGVIEDIEKILPLHYTEMTPERQWEPWGHTLTLTVGPADLKHEWRCYERESAPCREGREESDGCLYIEAMNDVGAGWYDKTVDGYDEEFPPLQVAFIDPGGGDFHWYNPAVGS